MRALQYHELLTLPPGAIVHAEPLAEPQAPGADLVIVGPNRAVWITDTNRQALTVPAQTIPLTEQGAYPTIIGYVFKLIALPRSV